MKQEAQKNPMGHEDLVKLIIRMSLPVMLSMLIQSLYNITDSFFVAKFSEKALRATSLSYPVQIIIVAFGVGTGLGVNSLISRSLGAGKEEQASQAAMHGLVLILFSWLLFILFRFTMLEKFFDFFTQDPEVKAMGMEYLGLITMFSVFSLVQITIEKTIQGTGDMVSPMIIQLIGAVTNIILDPIMIFGLLGFPAMGIRGAAIATLIGQGIAAASGLFILFSGKTSLVMNFKEFVFSWDVVKDVYQVGFPSILMQSMAAFVTTILNLIVVTHSELAVSVLGIYFKLESFVMMPLFGLGQGILPIMGYNYGAKNKQRVKDTFKYGLIIALVLMIVGVFLFQVFPRQLLGIFAENDEMIDMGVYTLRIISIGYMFAAYGVITSTLFQALGLGNLSLIITILRQFIIVVPLAYLLSSKGLNYIWIAYPIAEFVGLIVAIFLKKRVTRTRWKSRNWLGNARLF